jgi:DNA-binding transcriptional ArsR family regulator
MADSRVSPQAVQLYRLPPADRAQPPTDHDCLVALRALGEDTRMRIISLLIDSPLDVTDIARRVGVSQYNVSKHLRILREAGLLHVRKAGRRHLYALPDAIRQRAAAGAVLDLGCCSFKFGEEPLGTRGERPRKRPARLVARPSR